MSTDPAVDDFDVEALVAAKSDQLNADDLTGGPVTVRVLKVKKGKGKDQPMDIHIEGYKPWKPCKGMRRVLISLWGPPSPEWLGRTIRLYREPSVTWAGEEAGGIRLSGMSHISGSCAVPVAVSKGVKIKMRIEKLTPVVRQENASAEHPSVGFFTAATKLLDQPAEAINGFLHAQGIDPSSMDRKALGEVYKRLDVGGDLRALFDAGKDVPGAKLGERGEHIRFAGST